MRFPLFQIRNPTSTVMALGVTAILRNALVRDTCADLCALGVAIASYPHSGAHITPGMAVCIIQLIREYLSEFFIFECYSVAFLKIIVLKFNTQQFPIAYFTQYCDLSQLLHHCPLRNISLSQDATPEDSSYKKQILATCFVGSEILAFILVL